MYTVFVYADVFDLQSNKINKGTCIQRFHTEAKYLVDAIAEGEQHSYAISDIYDHVEFAVWNERSRTVDFRGRPTRVIADISAL